MTFARYAVYFCPPPGALAAFGAEWLGWDLTHGIEVQATPVPALSTVQGQLTDTPRKYGFHATIKPPFKLAEGKDEANLRGAFDALCAGLAPVRLDSLHLHTLGRFLALTPQGPNDALNAFAAEVVRSLDPFRAPSSAEDLAKRRANGLTARQDALLMQWGYPYVMEEFRFHMTLTGRVDRALLPRVEAALAAALLPYLPAPFDVAALTLLGEDAEGRFHEITRASLTGTAGG